VDYQVRVLGHSGDAAAGTVDLELSAGPGAAKRVFIVLDLSDSCRTAFQSLGKLTWLWQSLQPQWLVSIYALSSRDGFQAGAEQLHIRDLENYIRDLESAPEAEQWRAHHITRGSFIRYPLTGIYEVWQAENALQGEVSREALVFVLTDGELLDFAPLPIPKGMTIVGVLLPSDKPGLSRWPVVLPKSQAFPQGSPELLSYVRQLVTPSKQFCDVIPSFSCTVKGAPKSAGAASSSPRALRWDFAKGPLVLSSPVSVLGDATAAIEFRPKRGATTRINLESLALAIPGVAAEAGSDAPSATIAGGQLTPVTAASFAAQLVEHLRGQSSQGKLLDEPFASFLRSTASVAAANQTATPQSPAVRECDAAIVIALPPGGGAVSEPPSAVLVAPLYKSQFGRFLIRPTEGVPKDPGFTSKEQVRITYDVDAARWHLFRGTERKTLAPRAIEAIGDLFVDASGKACDAFYTGPLKLKNT